MRIKVKNYDKWIFPKEWLEALKTEFLRQLPRRKIRLIIDDKKQKDCAIRINGDSGKVLVHVNVCNDVKNDIITIFKKGYLKAVVEHEIKHLQPNFRYLFNKIIPPYTIQDTEGEDFYKNLYHLLNLKFQDFLSDVYANSGMSIEGLRQYLEFETNKICSDWETMNKDRIVRVPLMLFTSYIEACYTAIGENLPNELNSINNCLQDDYSNVAIHKQMVEIYLEMWNAVKKGQTEIDLDEKTRALQELILRQSRPLL